MTDTEQADAGQDEQDGDDQGSDEVSDQGSDRGDDDVSDEGSDRGDDQGSDEVSDDRDDQAADRGDDQVSDEGRLEQLEERIEAVRGQADEALAGAFPEEEEKFEESGEVGQEDDDQTIAPPG